MASTDTIAVYLEVGQKRVFAAALDWPGWCRSGRDETQALQALQDYAWRYERVPSTAAIEFAAPAAASAYNVVERLQGGSGTDFGAPQAIPTADARPLGDADLLRLETVLDACWQALDSAAQAATGRELRKGPRGGGRDPDAIVRHVLEAGQAYLGSVGWKAPANAEENLEGQLVAIRRATREALTAAAHGEVAPRGPRGGVRWPPRYFARRSAWHILDHVWEIEDRAQAG